MRHFRPGLGSDDGQAASRAFRPLRHSCQQRGHQRRTGGPGGLPDRLMGPHLPRQSARRIAVCAGTVSHDAESAGGQHHQCGVDLCPDTDTSRRLRHHQVRPASLDAPDGRGMGPAGTPRKLHQPGHDPHAAVRGALPRRLRAAKAHRQYSSTAYWASSGYRGSRRVSCQRCVAVCEWAGPGGGRGLS
ncbi:hypothetical protein D3C71_1665560 [compost metagenome]